MFSDYLDTIGFLAKYDPEVAGSMASELVRQRRNIELIASENIVSSAVLAAMGSVLTNKYAEGYPGRRYYGGCEFIDEVENLAIERAKKLFGAEHANVQPHSGAQANQAVYLALLELGDTVLGMNLAHGGHLTHGSPVNFSGINYNIVAYGVGEDGRIDYDEMRRLAYEHKPKMIIAGGSAYAREIRFDIFAEVAKEVDAFFMVDMAHIAGLVATGLHMNPVLYADVVTTTTHKTLRGPRGGLILCKEEYAKQIDKAVFPGTQGGPLEHIIAAKAVCFGEALKPEFADYQKRLVQNCAKLADEFIKHDIHMVSGGTDNHLILLDLRNYDISGSKLERRLDEVYITVNKNSVPGDSKGPNITSGIRVGTAAVTTRGFGEEEMIKIAEWIKLTITDFENAAPAIRQGVEELCKRHPIYE